MNFEKIDPQFLVESLTFHGIVDHNVVVDATERGEYLEGDVVGGGQLRNTFDRVRIERLLELAQLQRFDLVRDGVYLEVVLLAGDQIVHLGAGDVVHHALLLPQIRADRLEAYDVAVHQRIDRRLPAEQYGCVRELDDLQRFRRLRVERLVVGVRFGRGETVADRRDVNRVCGTCCERAKIIRFSNLSNLLIIRF